MITAIIIDDEQRSRDVLKKTIDKYCADVQVIGSGESVDEGIELIGKHNPDVVFLDVDMPKGNGFTLFDKIKNPSFEVIFITAYEEYAIKAFRIAAVDYLTKPIDYRLLQEAVNRLKHKQKLYLKEQRISLLLENMTNRSDEFNKIALPINEGYKLVKITDIVYCQADGAYTTIHLINGDRIVASKTLKAFEDILPAKTFFRVHKSSLINLNLVKSYSKSDGNLVIMEDGKVLEVSERNKRAFIDVLLKKTGMA